MANATAIYALPNRVAVGAGLGAAGTIALNFGLVDGSTLPAGVLTPSSQLGGSFNPSSVTVVEGDTSIQTIFYTPTIGSFGSNDITFSASGMIGTTPPDPIRVGQVALANPDEIIFGADRGDGVIGTFVIPEQHQVIDGVFSVRAMS